MPRCVFVVLAAVTAAWLARPSAGQCPSPLEYFRQVGAVSVLNSKGSTLFVGQPWLVELHDISTPDDPVRIASIPVSGEPSAIEPQGDLLYVSSYTADTGAQELMVANVADPSSPVVLARITWADRITDLAASTDRLCVLEESGAIRVLDTTDPAQPITGATMSNHRYHDLDMRLNLLYAVYEDNASGDAMLRVIGVSDIVTPNPITSINLGPTQQPPGLDRLGDTLAATAGDRLLIFSLATPNNPSLVGTGNGTREGSIPRLVEVGLTTYCHLLTAFQPVGLWSVGAGNPTFIDNYSIGARLVAPTESGAAYVSDKLSFLSAYQAVGPNPDLIWFADYGMPGRAFRMLSSGSALIFQENGSMGVDVFTLIDVADPARAAFLSRIEVGGIVTGVDTAESRLILMRDSSGLPVPDVMDVYDIADPTDPRLLTSLPLVTPPPGTGYYYDVRADDRLAVVQYEDEMLVMDMTDPAAPVVAAAVDVGNATQTELSDDVAAILNTNGSARVRVYDLTDPFVPVLASTIQEPDAVAIDLEGRLLIVERSTDEAAIYDLSVPASPALRSVIAWPSGLGSLESAYIVGSHAVLGGDSAHRVYDIADASSPASLGRIDLPESSDQAAKIGETIWLWDSLFALSAVRLGGTPVVTLQPTDQHACPGSSFTLTANASSDTPQAYRWLFNGVPLNNGSTAAGTVISGAFSRMLTVTNFQPADAGVLALLVTNACGRVLSDNAVVVAAGPPRISTQPAAQGACPFGGATFTVGVNNQPASAFRWQAEFPEGSGNYVDLTDVTTAQYTISGTGTATLTIAAEPDGRLTPILDTRYRAVATNACGSSTSNARRLTICWADVNCDAFLDFFDFDEYTSAFEAGTPERLADFNGDGFVDFFDYDAFVQVFESGC